jgi:hypothetical protein
VHRDDLLCAVDRLITSKDHASVQIAIADVDEDGKITGTATSFALCGQVRADGEADDSINRLATKAGCASLSIWIISARSRFGADLRSLLYFTDISVEECLLIPEVIWLACVPFFMGCFVYCFLTPFLQLHSIPHWTLLPYRFSHISGDLRDLRTTWIRH